MSLRTAFKIVLEEYPIQQGYAFTGNDLARFIRTDLPRRIEAIIEDDQRYKIRGSAGRNTWANCPWVAIFDRLVTATAQRGYYVAYLFQEDFGGLYLSLIQGMMRVRETYGAHAKHALAAKASDYLAQLGSAATGLIHGPINLKSRYSTSLASDYEVGSVCAKYYDVDALPSDDVLAEDLKLFLHLYALLTDKEAIRDNEAIGDVTALRFYKRMSPVVE